MLTRLFVALPLLATAAFAVGADAREVSVPPVRNYRHRSATLADIQSHMPAGHIYNCADVRSTAHETMHGLNSRIRNQYGGTGRVNAVYCGHGRAVVLIEPPVTLAEVARNVPLSQRGISFRLYLIQQQRWWNREPLYILDEWSAYAAAVAVGCEIGDVGQSDVQQMVELLGYSHVLRTLAKRQRGYDSRPLEAFLEWQKRQTEQLRAATGREHTR